MARVVRIRQTSVSTAWETGRWSPDRDGCRDWVRVRRGRFASVSFKPADAAFARTTKTQAQLKTVRRRLRHSRPRPIGVPPVSNELPVGHESVAIGP